MGTIWGWMKLLLQLWNSLMALIGIIEKEQHEKKNETIKEKTDIAGDPEKPDQERLDAIEELEKITNRHAKR